MSDIVNIDLALPAPIRFKIGADTYTISGDISFRNGLRTNQLIMERQRLFDESQRAVGDAILARENGDNEEMEVRGAESQELLVKYEEAGDALLAHIEMLLKAHDSKQSAAKLSTATIDRMAGVIWSRAMGATDEQLERLGDKEEEVTGPPIKPNRSTRRNGSTASAKRTAAARQSGSRSR